MDSGRTLTIIAVTLGLAACVSWKATHDGENMSTHDLSGQDLSDTLFTNVDLSGANLSGANLNGSKFENCNLQRANLSGANLVGAQFPQSDLSGADLSNARTDTSTSFPQATLFNARLDGVDRFACSSCWCPDGEQILVSLNGCESHRAHDWAAYGNEGSFRAPDVTGQTPTSGGEAPGGEATQPQPAPEAPAPEAPAP